MKEFPTGWIVLLFASTMLFSCSIIRKSGGSSKQEATHIDSSSLRKQHTKETTTIQVSDTTIQTRADSLSLEEFFSLWDIVEHKRSMQAGALQVDITATPKFDSATGKPSGIDIKAKARKAPENVCVPVNTTTRIKEEGSEEKRVIVKNTQIETESWWSKQTKRLPAWWPLAAIASGIGVILIRILKYLKR